MNAEQKPKLSKKIIRLIIASILVVASASTGLVVGIKIANNTATTPTISKDPLDEVTKLLEDNWLSDIYYGKDIDQNTLIDQFIGALSTNESKMLDPYTYLIKKTPSIIDTNGKMGITISRICNYPVVSSIKEDAAAKGYLQVGDIVYAVGKDVDDNVEYHYVNNPLETYNSVFSSSQGKVGDKVYVKYYRNDGTGKLVSGEVNFLLKKDTEDPYAYLVEDNIDDSILVKYTSFVDATSSYNSASQLDAILKSNPSKNLILDLRDNGGGDLSSAVSVADMFLPKGKLIVKLEYKSQQIEYYTKTDEHYEYDNIFVLQNGNTASASEILISALTYHLGDKVTLIGTKTYGKGIGQRTMSVLDGKYSLKMTCSRWYRPDGSWIGMTGSYYTDGYSLGFSPKNENLITYDQKLYTFEYLNSNIYYKDSEDFDGYKEDKVNATNAAFFATLNKFYDTEARIDSYYDNTNIEAIKTYQTLKGLDVNGVMDELTYVYFVNDMFSARVEFNNSFVNRAGELI